MAGSFQADLSAFGQKALDNFDKIRRASALELFRLIIYSTPVDKGRLRGNWQATINQPATGELDRADSNGSATLTDAMANLGGMMDVVYFVNNLPYAERIEYGYSSQEPEGMVRKHVANWQQIVEAKARALAV